MAWHVHICTYNVHLFVYTKIDVDGMQQRSMGWDTLSLIETVAVYCA